MTCLAKHFFSTIALTLLVVLFQPLMAHSDTIIRTNALPDSPDLRFQYPGTLLKAALDITTDEYGPYEIKPLDQQISRNRALIELGKGNIEVFSAPTRQNWEEEALPVRIPLRRGLGGFKLLFIHEADKDKFASIQDINIYKRIPMGGGSQWSSTLAYNKMGFTMVGGTEYAALFDMFQGGRFDFFPRGINEVYKELAKFGPKVPDMIIEPTVAFYLPNPTYFFISPKQPELAERIERGLNKLVWNGTFDKLFFKSFSENIIQADLNSRP